MNAQSKQHEQTETKNFCSTTHYATNQVIVNSYKCDQTSLSALDMWKIQKQRKQVTIGSTISVN